MRQTTATRPKILSSVLYPLHLVHLGLVRHLWLQRRLCKVEAFFVLRSLVLGGFLKRKCYDTYDDKDSYHGPAPTIQRLE